MLNANRDTSWKFTEDIFVRIFNKIEKIKLFARNVNFKTFKIMIHSTPVNTTILIASTTCVDIAH